MTSASRLPLLLTVQRHHLETPGGEVHPALTTFRTAVQQAREQGLPLILVQWDGDLFDAAPETFSREWVLHPDIRAEAGDLLVRASRPDPFAAETDKGTLGTYLRSLGQTELAVWALPDAPELAAALEHAPQHGLTLHVMPLQGVMDEATASDTNLTLETT